MSKSKNNSLFDTIAPIYGFFYNFQRRRFEEVLGRTSKELDLNQFKTILDVGCGTGALSSVLNDKGFLVTGIDPANKMLRVAKSKSENKGVVFFQADVLKRLPFEDKSFDISIASYVAHGMQKNEREKMYSEMSRVTKHKVIIYDYNQNRGLSTSLVEWLERGDYFRFIKVAESEMKNCTADMKSCFSQVKVIDVDTRAAWYVCTPA